LSVQQRYGGGYEDQVWGKYGTVLSYFPNYTLPLDLTDFSPLLYAVMLDSALPVLYISLVPFF